VTNERSVQGDDTVGTPPLVVNGHPQAVLN